MPTPHTPAPLKCPGTTDDTHSWDETKNYGLVALAENLLLYQAASIAEAIKQRDAFTDQKLLKPDEFKKTKINAPAPTFRQTITLSKNGSYDVKYSTAWTASVTVEKKTAFEKAKPKDITPAGVKTPMCWQYACIDGSIWIQVCNQSGNVVYSSIKTNVKCSDDVPSPPYRATSLCFEGFWCIVIKDPKGKEIMRHFTEEPCGKKEEPKKEEPKKEEPKKDEPKK